MKILQLCPSILQKLLLFCLLARFATTDAAPPQSLSQADLLKQAESMLAQYQNGAGVQSSLTLAQISQNPDVWPAYVTTEQELGLGNGLVIAPGTKLPVVNVSDNQVQLAYQNRGFGLPAEMTDIVEAANAVASGVAAAAGYRGRAVELLEASALRLEGGKLAPVKKGDLGAPSLILVYYGANYCGWCRQLEPTFSKKFAELQKRYGEKLQIVHFNVDRTEKDMTTYAKKLGAEIPVLPRTSAWAEHVFVVESKGRYIVTPSFALMNSNGRVLDLSFREPSSLKESESFLNRIDAYLAKMDAYLPQWQTSEPSKSMVASSAPPEKTVAASPSIPAGVHSTSESLEQIGVEIRTDRGERREHAFRLEKRTFPEDMYYEFTFREIEGAATLGLNKPVLTSFIAVRGELSKVEQTLDRLEDLASKFREWSDLAKSNQVTDYSKAFGDLPGGAVEGKYITSAIAIPGSAPKPPLEFTFVVRSNSLEPVMKVGHLTWTRERTEDFLQLLPQARGLIAALGAEEQRVRAELQQEMSREDQLDQLFQ